MANIVDDDISENEHHHWQTDVFNNIEIDDVHRKKSCGQLFQCTVK